MADPQDPEPPVLDQQNNNGPDPTINAIVFPPGQVDQLRRMLRAPNNAAPYTVSVPEAFVSPRLAILKLPEGSSAAAVTRAYESALKKAGNIDDPVGRVHVYFFCLLNICPGLDNHLTQLPAEDIATCGTAVEDLEEQIRAEVGRDEAEKKIGKTSTAQEIVFYAYYSLCGFRKRADGSSWPHWVHQRQKALHADLSVEQRGVVTSDSEAATHLSICIRSHPLLKRILVMYGIQQVENTADRFSSTFGRHACLINERTGM